jgi:Tfp pilus assembly protein PilF
MTMETERDVAGTLWKLDETVKYGGRFIITTDGIVLKCEVDDSLLPRGMDSGDIYITDLGGSPEPRVECQSGSVMIQVHGVVAIGIRSSPPYVMSRLLVQEPAIDPEGGAWPSVTVKLAGDDLNPRIKIPISLGLAASARRTLVKTARPVAVGEQNDSEDDESKVHVEKAESADSLVQRGLNLEESHPRQALALYDAAVQKEPRHVDALFCRARLLAIRGDFDKSIKDLAQVTAINLKHWDALIQLGQVWLKKGDPEQALQVFERFRVELEKDPDKRPNGRIELYLARAGAWIAKGDFDKALADYGEVIFLSPRQTEAYTGRADIWKKRGDFDKALQDYREALRQSPGDSKACRA